MTSKFDRMPFGVIIGGDEGLRKRIENTVLASLLGSGFIAAIIWLFYHGVTWIEITSAVSGYAIVAIGLGLGVHRYFSHQSFKTNFTIRCILGALGAMGGSGRSILIWVADHRRHHAHPDACGDVHSPHIDSGCHPTSTWAGLLHAHFGCWFDETTSDMHVYAKDLIADPLVTFYHRTRWFWFAFSHVILPGSFGLICGNAEDAIGSILIGGFLRTFVYLNFVLALGHVGHRWGSVRYRQDNNSRNNYFIALALFGDGFHNNHHFFPRGAMAAHRWWELDINGYVILAMEKLGLVWDVVRMPESLKQGAGHANSTQVRSTAEALRVHGR